MVRREIVLPNPREEVWEALTDPERLEDWFANDVDLDLRPGGGAPGKRFALPNAKIMIHQGSGGFRGTPADIQIAAREILAITRKYAEIIARHSRKDVEQVMHDIDRDRFLAPEEAVEYGLVDSVLSTRQFSPGS